MSVDVDVDMDVSVNVQDHVAGAGLVSARLFRPCARGLLSVLPYSEPRIAVLGRQP